MALVAPIVGLGFLTQNILATSSEFLPGYRVPWHGDSVIYYHMDYALNSDEYNDVIFLGSSAAMAGLHTLAFEQQTGLRAYNFGTVIDLGPDGQLEMVRAYVENHPKPQMLVYLAFPRDLMDNDISDPDIRTRFARAYNASLDDVSINKSLGVQDYFIAGYWTIYGMVTSRGVDLLAVPRGNRPSHLELGPALSRERGWQPYPQARVLNIGYLNGIEAFTVSEWYDRNLTEMANFAREQGIDFLVYFMPTPRITRDIDDAPVLSWAAEFKTDFPQVSVEGLPIEAYEHPLWGNGYHLNPEGADVFTEQVGQTILDLLQ